MFLPACVNSAIEARLYPKNMGGAVRVLWKEGQNWVQFVSLGYKFLKLTLVNWLNVDKESTVITHSKRFTTQQGDGAHACSYAVYIGMSFPGLMLAQRFPASHKHSWDALAHCSALHFQWTNVGRDTSEHPELVWTLIFRKWHKLNLDHPHNLTFWTARFHSPSIYSVTAFGAHYLCNKIVEWAD